VPAPKAGCNGLSAWLMINSDPDGGIGVADCILHRPNIP